MSVTCDTGRSDYHHKRFIYANSFCRALSGLHFMKVVPVSDEALNSSYFATQYHLFQKSFIKEDSKKPELS